MPAPSSTSSATITPRSEHAFHLDRHVFRDVVACAPLEHGVRGEPHGLRFHLEGVRRHYLGDDALQFNGLPGVALDARRP